MRLPVTAVCCLPLLLVTGCGADLAPAQDTGPAVGVVLPDRTTSARWEEQDRPLLQGAFERAGVRAAIENAEGDETRFAALVDRMIGQGVRVIVMTPLSADGGRAAQEKAATAGVSVIDYERLTPGGRAEYHVGFDNVRAGRLQAEELLRCTGAGARIAELLGGADDPNTAQFAAGNQEVLADRYLKGERVLVERRHVDRWDPEVATRQITEILDRTGNDVDGVLAANDGIASAVLTVLRARGLAGRVAVTGMDGTTEALRAVLRGEQCMSVHKPIRDEAEAAAQLALALVRGKPGSADDLVSGNVRDGSRNVKAILLGPEVATRRTIGRLVSQNAVRGRALCAGEFAQLCQENQITVR
ncbi:sugar ABC transporter substrate-binding protein [Lentzea sp. NPDC058436]|uniref:sugar ABC transporter substrate-binding protein n=1 Tax=Lentzea sp. NPDC058436 TaxID=3346499 RepID=UPI00365AEECF